MWAILLPIVLMVVVIVTTLVIIEGDTIKIIGREISLWQEISQSERKSEGEGK